jgi:hypothetical protein
LDSLLTFKVIQACLHASAVWFFKPLRYHTAIY